MCTQSHIPVVTSMHMYTCTCACIHMAPLLSASCTSCNFVCETVCPLPIHTLPAPSPHPPHTLPTPSPPCALCCTLTTSVPTQLGLSCSHALQNHNPCERRRAYYGTFSLRMRDVSPKFYCFNLNSGAFIEEQSYRLTYDR